MRYDLHVCPLCHCPLINPADVSKLNARVTELTRQLQMETAVQVMGLFVFGALIPLLVLVVACA